MPKNNVCADIDFVNKKLCCFIGREFQNSLKFSHIQGTVHWRFCPLSIQIPEQEAALDVLQKKEVRHPLPKACISKLAEIDSKYLIASNDGDSVRLLEFRLD